MKVIRYLLLACISAVAIQLLFSGCSKDDTPPVTEEERIALKAKKFVYDYTSEAYLWRDRISSSIDYRSASSPEELFEMMRYRELDKWSYVSDNSQQEMEGFQGVSTTFGYSLAFGTFTNKPDVYFAVVMFVYDGSPAKSAGLERGDIILTLGGENLTKENYMQLYYAPSVKIGLGDYTEEGIKDSGKTLSLTAVKMYEDPVVTTKILDVNGTKVGYLFYAGYYEESHGRLADVFADFEAEGVSELILDLRYNPGGNAQTPPYLASFIAPENVVKNRSVFLTQTWNDLYMKYFKQKGEDMNTYFVPGISANLNLKRVFVLTTGSTASASEATISGLMPYMDVIKIGSATYGKYCGAALLMPTDSNGNRDSEIGNWLLSLVVYKFVNAEGFTEFKNGIAPDYNVEDGGLLRGIPLGDESDPMVAKALSIIGGTTSAVPSDVHSADGIRMLPELGNRPFRGGYNMIGLFKQDQQ